MVEALVELLGGGLSQPKDLLKGEVHLVVEEDAEGLAKVLLLEPLDEGLHVLEVLLKEGLLLEDGRHQIELVERRSNVLGAEVVARDELREVAPLALRRLVLRLAAERRPLVDSAVRRSLE